jgi:hypothetical protein
VITFGGIIRSIISKGSNRKYLQSYAINNTMKYMILLSGLTPIGSKKLKLQKCYSTRVSATFPIRNSLQPRSLTIGNFLKKQTKLQSNKEEVKGLGSESTSLDQWLIYLMKLTQEASEHTGALDFYRHSSK